MTVYVLFSMGTPVVIVDTLEGATSLGQGNMIVQTDDQESPRQIERVWSRAAAANQPARWMETTPAFAAAAIADAALR
jgi:hypothetical protein